MSLGFDNKSNYKFFTKRNKLGVSQNKLILEQLGIHLYMKNSKKNKN